jgi:hypothetical protein
LQNLSQKNGDKLNIVRHETSRTQRKKKRDYLKEEINKLEGNKNIRDLYRTYVNL